ncbi:Biopolymer transport protein ExbB [Anatilimnocola aggregata]|uniref:Biopolymer transport protein ExbB n=1 Tax=Anatilimnocola aggregata TaxID=2528021 RepID=A0A517YM45_9BACT|nr:MotA/TolQ/ExbB proton channel family protein [Anatilimnocola aggregata]QDU31292.1 Biopolymer transport protein ExbB [Anatilimnocola aggregata]
MTLASLLLTLALAGQVDDILNDEASAQKNKGAKPAATAPATPAPVAPKVNDPALATEPTADAAAAAKAPGGKGDDKKAEGKAGDAEPEEGSKGEGDDKEKSDEPTGTAKLFNDLTKTGALGYMIEGGIFMWPILFLGILAFGVIIERYRALLMLNTKDEALRSQVLKLMQSDKIEDALELVERHKGPVPAILGAGLRKYLIARRLGYDPAKIEEQVTKGMDEYSVHIVAAMEKHLPILATVASAAPMLGFLGTVSGMVSSFAEIVATMGEKNIVEAAAGGIMVSLLTTVLGLIVGIPAFVAFNYFTSTINGFVLDVQESAAELIEAVTFQLALAGRESDVAELPPVTTHR